MSKLRLSIISLASAILITFSLFRIFASSSYDEATGWIQVLLGALSAPVLYYELYQIRQAVGQKPAIEIGLANVRDLPLSKIRSKDLLPAELKVGQGYSHFSLVIRNRGNVAAKFVKVHLEYLYQKRTALPDPAIEISEFSKEKLGFIKENNVDFLFIGGSDWCIHPSDFEIFSFHLAQGKVKQIEPLEMKDDPFPRIGKYHFWCTVWADGQSHPISRELIVEVVEKI